MHSLKENPKNLENYKKNKKITPQKIVTKRYPINIELVLIKRRLILNVPKWS